MQKVKIDVYISDLLYSYDCVIVPEFGGFIANYAPAKIQAVHHKFHPPSKKISFNKHLKNNDGLLGNHIANRRSISYQEANELIRSFVNQTLAGLNNGDRIEIENVGTLFLDPEKNIQFKAEEQNDYLRDAFGLKPFRALPIIREEKERIIEKKVEESLPVIKEEIKKRRRYYWPAAAVLFFAISIFSLNRQYDWVDSPNISYSKFWLNKGEAKYALKELNIKESVETFEVKSELTIKEGVNPYFTPEGEKTNLFTSQPIEDLATRKDNTKTVVNNSVQGLKFHVMGGCFSMKSNAMTLADDLRMQGFDSKLLEGYKSFYSVSFGSFSDRKSALELLKEVRKNNNSEAWLLVKSF